MCLCKFNHIFSVVLFAFLLACTGCRDAKLSDVIVYNLNNKEVRINFNEKEKFKAFFFLSPECPFCINYTKTISEIINNPNFSDITFYAVFPGTFYSNKEIRNFQEEYNFQINTVTDPKLKLTKMLNATVTPQVVITESNGEIVYTGAIDNWAVDTGVKRQVISEHYLLDALESVISGKIPAVTKTKPVGCYIEL